MNEEQIRELLSEVRGGRLEVDAALKRLKLLPYQELKTARVDSHRALRTGFPEVIFCQSKEPRDIAAIAKAILLTSDRLLATRAGPEAYRAIRTVEPRAVYHERARCVVVERRPSPPREGRILVVSAGTADIPVAEEARVTAETMGHRVETLYDAGVAGIHRLLGSAESIMEASVIVVVAGMEGALASVVGGLASAPVVAVPTSVGYGASFGGIAPLLTMLNSCSAGVAVVNIDNGFGAGYLAALINTRRSHSGPHSTAKEGDHPAGASAQRDGVPRRAPRARRKR